nr:polyprenyl diphosphate synthase [Aquabacterium terrae]
MSIPQHVAIVMDGNGRWAKKRFLPRFFGHKAGVDALIRIIDACADRGIRYLTVFAFSSENWKRPADEVSGLMGLVLVAQAKYMQKMVGNGVRVVIAGDREAVSDRLRKAWNDVEEATKSNHRLTLTVAFNYGGRWDMVQACRRAVADGLKPEQIDEEALSRYMAMGHAPDPDLFIRTGGEVRISNFLLWQAAYSELLFTDCLWPDFGEAELDAALAAYAGRERRFGALNMGAAAHPA